MNILNWLNQKNYDTSAYEEMLPYIEVWKQWHAGHVPSFHNYTISNGSGKSKKKLEKKTLNMASLVCRNYADLLLNEKVIYNVGDEKLTELINNVVLEPNNFSTLINNGQELIMALGTGALVKSLNGVMIDNFDKVTTDDKTNIKIDFVMADQIIPLTYDVKDITECAFLSSEVYRGNELINISLHLLDDEDYYYIENHHFTLDKNNNIKRFERDDIPKVFRTGTKLAWFNIIRPNISNTINLNSPFGMSIFHTSIPQLKGIDTIYDSLINEFTLGKKRIWVDSSMLKVDELTGEAYFDDNDLVMYQLEGNAYGDTSKNTPKSMMSESNMELRIADHKTGIDLALAILSQSVGLGDNYYSFERGSVKTATEVVSDNSQLYRSMKKQEIPINNALTEFFMSVLEIGEVHKLKGITTQIQKENSHEHEDNGTELASVTINFDDSIIEDEETIIKRALTEYSAGLISDIQYYMITKNLSRQQAEDYYKDKINDSDLTVDLEEEGSIGE